MHKVIFIIIWSTSFICGQNYNLDINLKDGSKVTFKINEIRKIDFNNITNMNDAQKLQQVIKSFKLMQNYPNPFNPSTTISYQLSKMSKVKVSIYNLNGQLVGNILDEPQSKGLHKIHWDGKNQNNKRVSSGVYIYTVESDNIILSKKMILLK